MTIESGTPSWQLVVACLYLADEYPELGLRAPAPDAVSVSLMLHVADTDAALARAREHGATVVREVYEGYGSRGAAIIDPFGHRWMLSGPMIGAIAPIRHGDVGYVSVWTPDADKAAVFYGQVLGWVYDPRQHEVTNTTLPTGLFTAYASRLRRRRDAVLLLRGGRPGRRQRGDSGCGWHGRRDPGVQFRHRAGCHRHRKAPRSPSTSRPATHRALSSMALGQANFRISPTRLATRRRSASSMAGCCTGHSNPAGLTTGGRSRRVIRWAVWPAVAPGRRRYRCGRWPISMQLCSACGRPGGTVISEPAASALRIDGRVHRRPGCPVLPR